MLKPNFEEFINKGLDDAKEAMIPKFYSNELQLLESLLFEEVQHREDYKVTHGQYIADNIIEEHQKIIRYLEEEILKLKKRKSTGNKSSRTLKFFWLKKKIELERLYLNLNGSCIENIPFEFFYYIFTPNAERPSNFEKVKWLKSPTLFTYFLVDLLIEERFIKNIKNKWETSKAHFTFDSDNLRKYYNNLGDRTPKGGEALKKILLNL